MVAEGSERQGEVEWDPHYLEVGVLKRDVAWRSKVRL